MWTQAFFSLDFSTVSLRLDTCYVQGGIPQLTQASEEERRNRVLLWCPQSPQRCPVMWASALGGCGRGNPGWGNAAHAKLSHPETCGPQFLLSSHSCSLRPHDYPHPSWISWTIPGLQRWTQPHHTFPFLLVFCCSPLVSTWPRTMQSWAISTPALG